MESIVAQRIKSVLESKQISIAAFAKMIGMQQVTCNRQIRGDQAVSDGFRHLIYGKQSEKVIQRDMSIGGIPDGFYC